jgi:ATP-dependent exoDNAse (exonuclease V) beta subunit
MAWGTLIHGLLEHAMRHKTASHEDLRRLAMWLTMEEPQLRAVIDEAIDTVRAVAEGQFWQEARMALDRHEEAPFGIRMMEGDGKATVLNGIVDLIYRTANGWSLVDYKTDTDGSAVDLHARYRGQIDAYEKAWSRFVDGAISSTLVGTRATPPRVAT